LHSAMVLPTALPASLSSNPTLTNPLSPAESGLRRRGASPAGFGLTSGHGRMADAAHRQRATRNECESCSRQPFIRVYGKCFSPEGFFPIARSGRC
jgi:hypothetical protein